MTAERTPQGEHHVAGDAGAEQRGTMGTRARDSLLPGRTADTSGASPEGA